MSKFLLLALGLCSLTACTGLQPAATKASLQATFAGQQVSLIDTQGRCTLARPGNAPLSLDMQWPCRFSEDAQQNVRVEHFRQAQIIMVEHIERAPAPGKGCTTDLQPIRALNGKLEVAPVSRIPVCGPGQWDQKAFVWQFDW